MNLLMPLIIYTFPLGIGTITQYPTKYSISEKNIVSKKFSIITLKIDTTHRAMYSRKDTIALCQFVHIYLVLQTPPEREWTKIIRYYRHRHNFHNALAMPGK